ncbi:MAG: protoheme IX farnesyltransferase [Elusimicrobia bacterium]|nr:protoheme IX farnesyltransferase [Elusimicrobiota bacterium]
MTKDILALFKGRIALMVMSTSGLGYWLSGARDARPLLCLLAGTALSSCACGVLNQYLERREDRLMRRTSSRPLPAGSVKPEAALALGGALSAAGIGLLAAGAGGLAAALTALTLILYLGLYTPLKKITPHTTWLGAAAGAMPPLIGWAAGMGHLEPRAWALFAIQFLWQIPHFLSLFWIYREEYAAAGFRVMPVVDPNGGLTAFQMALHSFTVLLASLFPLFLGMAGLGYAIGALLLSTAYLGLGMRASWTLAALDTRRLFMASLAYLPLLFGMLLFGGV